MVEMIDDEKLNEYRNIVMQRLNHTDMLISSIICIYYLKTGMVSMGFLSNVLYQQPLSFSSRTNMLRNILKEMENKNEDEKESLKKIRKELNKLDKMATIRNFFAHCELKIKLKGKEEYVFSPKDFSKPTDFEKEYKKFIKLDNKANPILFQLYEQLGGKFFKDKPNM